MNHKSKFPLAETVHFINTGGTVNKVGRLSDEPDFNKWGFNQEDPDWALRDILSRRGKTAIDHVIMTIMLKDSLDMTEEDRILICLACQQSPHDRIVVVHGTDTMIESALRVQELNLPKRIRFTGAMQPYALNPPQAAYNVYHAEEDVSKRNSVGTAIVMSGRVLDPRRARKNYDTLMFEKS